MSKKHHGKKHEEHEESEAWLLPYSDLMTLLLAVFIVLFLVSQVDVQKATAMARAFSVFSSGSSGIFNANSSGKGEGTNKDEFPWPPDKRPSPKPSGGNPGGSTDWEDLNVLKNKLDALFQSVGLQDFVYMGIDEKGLVISFESAALFDSGKADLKPEYTTTLAEVGKTLQAVDRQVRIEGHTDNLPIHTAQFPDNWVLSFARAKNVMDLFLERSAFDPQSISATGYGEQHPIADNNTEEGRTLNRRVDVVVVSRRYEALEQHEPTPKPTKTPKNPKESPAPSPGDASEAEPTTVVTTATPEPDGSADSTTD